ncbi:bifunctional DNA primase/polymerase [Tengunoibacter tsumagoiensis]|uniref:DNA primase/polymerase bifunctional N-terminal domain-containing protein n=1 Tax=Tengunoibacter tsumagoiensis TaxID=2014871 RepID=A0A402A8I6_9CHLR|nr:bifunctional DNA primase/polymerase [Tengunoibacter tsumagoiensis]GCE15305.1 hypothetical protein KTT_51640 [Tengunoibacter tsumagoiensis]
MTTTSMSAIWNEQEPFQTARYTVRHFQWSILPCDKDKGPVRIGGLNKDGTPKRFSWGSLQNRHPSLQEVEYWQKTYQPPLWSLVTGAINQRVVLDFDGKSGQKTLEQLGLSPHVQTGSGGYHVHFHHPGWHVPTLAGKSNKELGQRWPGLDIRGDGGNALFCGESHAGRYLWLRDPEPDDLLQLPEALVAFLHQSALPEHRIALSEESPNASVPEVAETAHETLLTRALTRVIKKEAGRNDTGFWLACQLRDHHYSLEMAREILERYCQQTPKENTKGGYEPYTREEAFASLASAYKDSHKKREPWVINTKTMVISEPSHMLPESDLLPSSGQASNGNGHGSPPTTGQRHPDGEAPLPDIIVGTDQLRNAVDKAIEAIQHAEQHAPTLFLQAARLVSIGQDEEKRPIITQMSVPEVKEVMTHSANFYRLKKASVEEGGSIQYPVSPPKEIAEQILARQSNKPYLPFPPLTAIVETPVIRQDGSVLSASGYDKKSRLYYAPQEGMGNLSVPLDPTPEQRQAALTLIWDVIGEFPYATDADKANALGLLLTPLLRPAIKRHVPMALIDAPKQGTGKGLLSDVVSIIATGMGAMILTLSDNPDELQKSITSLLIEGATMITIDNVVERLQSKHLDAVLTSDWWRGRILGASKMARVPQRATWIATGNNIRLGGDIARRCYRIRLDARMSKPFKRKGFKHTDLASWALEHRAEIVGALLTLARAWYAAGKPRYEHLPAMGTMTGWVEVVGGILEYAGVSGFLANLDTLQEQADEEGPQWETFLLSWRKVFGEEWTSVSDLSAIITGEGKIAGGGDTKYHFDLIEALPEPLQITLKEKPKSFKICLGKALDKHVETCFGEDNLRLEKTFDKHNKKSLWRVVAGNAGSLSNATQSENVESSLGDEVDVMGYEIDGKHSLHTPQKNGQKKEQTCSKGSPGHTAAIEGYCEKSLPPSLPLQSPADGHRKEKRDL